MRFVELVALGLVVGGCGDAEPEEYTTEVHVGGVYVCFRSNLDRVACRQYEAADTSEDVPQPREKYQQISMGAYHVCGLTDEGEVECWLRKAAGVVPRWDGRRAGRTGAGTGHPSSCSQGATGSSQYGLSAGSS